MNKILIVLILHLILASEALSFSSCKSVSENEWVCKDIIEYSVTRIVYSKNQFWIKSYYPEERGKQTEATVVYKSSIKEFENQYKANCFVKTRQYDFGFSISESRNYCDSLWNEFLYNNSQGIHIDFLDGIKTGETPLHIVYCMEHNYIRTYDYDEITTLEVNRKDYYNIPPRNYCTEFLSTNKIKLKI